MKKILFGGILALAAYLVIELMAFTAYSIKFGEYKLYDIQHSKLDTIKSLNSGGVYVQEDYGDQEIWRRPIIHPYIGYAYDAKRKRKGCESDKVEDCYTRIKVYTDKTFEKRAPNKLIIAILGGSFADAIGRIGEPTIINSLRQAEKYKNHEIVVYNLGAGGFKQPQQLTRLAYFYSLGAEFDLVINIDGFNEMATNYNNYRDRKVHPSFPIFWNNRVASSMTQTYLELYSEKRQTQKSHASLAEFWLLEGVRYSPLMNVVWRIIDQNFSRKLAALEQQIAVSSETKNRDFAYEALGPDYAFSSWEKFHKDVADIWVNSSLATNALVEGQGGRYYHFLQPNQYIEGNKILSKWEAKNAILEQNSYGNVYHNSYPVILEKAPRLIKNDVKYHDFTFIFKDISDTLYIDNCCHINKKGIDVFSREIISVILQDLIDSPPQNFAYASNDE